MTKTITEDIDTVASDDSIPWQDLSGKNILITGGTGLIGSLLAKSLLVASKKRRIPLKILLPVRNLAKAKSLFGHCAGESLSIFEQDICNIDAIKEDVAYIVHGAAPTASIEFIQHPVEVIENIFLGTRSVLRLGQQKKISSMVFLSSMEVYGYGIEGEIREDQFGLLDPCKVRSSYPEAKRISETLCCAHYKEYGTPVKVARLTQCFGAGVDVKTDKRIFAEFARAALEHKDITLFTTGQTKRCYAYTTDAVRGILKILLEGSDGAAYNVANPETFCSIYEFATLVANHYGINVKIKLSKEEAEKFCEENKTLLNVDRLTALGWQPKYDLLSSFVRLVESSAH